MTPKEKRFCEEYLVDLNPVQAAIRAGYAVSTARSASKWIHPEHPEKPTLRARVDALLAERSRRTGVTADRVLLELARIGFANLTAVVDPSTGSVRPDAPPDDSAALASVRVRRGADFTEHEVRLCDKTRALELIGRHLGLFDDRVTLSGAVPVVISGGDRLED